MAQTPIGAIASVSAFNGKRLKVVVVGEGGNILDVNCRFGHDRAKNASLPNYLPLPDGRRTQGSLWTDGGVLDTAHPDSKLAACTIERLNVANFFYQLPDGSIVMRRCSMESDWKWETGYTSILSSESEYPPDLGTSIVVQPSVLRAGDGNSLTSSSKLDQTSSGHIGIQRMNELGELQGTLFRGRLSIPRCTPFTALMSGNNFTISYITLNTQEIWECNGTLTTGPWRELEDDESYVSAAQRVILETPPTPFCVQMASYQADQPIFYSMVSSTFKSIVWSSNRARRSYRFEVRGMPGTPIALSGYSLAWSSLNVLFVDITGAVNIGRLGSGSVDGTKQPECFPIPLGSMRNAFSWAPSPDLGARDVLEEAEECPAPCEVVQIKETESTEVAHECADAQPCPSPCPDPCPNPCSDEAERDEVNEEHNDASIEYKPADGCCGDEPIICGAETPVDTDEGVLEEADRGSSYGVCSTCDGNEDEDVCSEPPFNGDADIVVEVEQDICELPEPYLPVEEMGDAPFEDPVLSEESTTPTFPVAIPLPEEPALISRTCHLHLFLPALPVQVVLACRSRYRKRQLWTQIRLSLTYFMNAFDSYSNLLEAGTYRFNFPPGAWIKFPRYIVPELNAKLSDELFDVANLIPNPDTEISRSLNIQRAIILQHLSQLEQSATSTSLNNSITSNEVVDPLRPEANQVATSDKAMRIIWTHTTETELMGYLDVKTGCESLHDARSLFRKSGRSYIDTSKPTLPITMTPFDWYEASQTSWILRSLIMIRGAQSQLDRKLSDMDSLTAQLIPFIRSSVEDYQDLELEVQSLKQVLKQSDSNSSVASLLRCIHDTPLSDEPNDRDFDLATVSNRLGAIKAIDRKLMHATRSLTLKRAQETMTKPDGTNMQLRSSLESKILEHQAFIEAYIKLIRASSERYALNLQTSISQVHLPYSNDPRWSIVNISTEVPNTTWDDAAVGVGLFRVSLVNIDRGAWFKSDLMKHSDQFMRLPVERILQGDFVPKALWPLCLLDNILIKIHTPEQASGATKETLIKQAATAHGILGFGFAPQASAHGNPAAMHISLRDLYKLGYMMQLTPPDLSVEYNSQLVESSIGAMIGKVQVSGRALEKVEY
ncbi:hypothetical protein RhiXN_11904 [Rhizoctonia solani]|uniref:Uncharacterized protein n=1 Tax=Rhizoctonia solani TaxID=456999 RepID=A0A8H8P9F6_9AGAM|nr:uncharacterized protein RhiXN_11904 [Rhizoctonia solani]QRW26243.1 hypothetical protein RhiXN_11904 [Rhizoctonia solani]